MPTFYVDWNRDTSKDTVVYDTPATLYTDSTTLTTSMTLYDDTGTDTGYKVGEISQDGNSFDLLKNYQLNVEGYAYTADSNDNITLTGYTSSNTDVVIPNLEEV